MAATVELLSVDDINDFVDKNSDQIRDNVDLSSNVFLLALKSKRIIPPADYSQMSAHNNYYQRNVDFVNLFIRDPTRFMDLQRVKALIELCDPKNIHHPRPGLRELMKKLRDLIKRKTESYATYESFVKHLGDKYGESLELDEALLNGLKEEDAGGNTCLTEEQVEKIEHTHGGKNKNELFFKLLREDNYGAQLPFLQFIETVKSFTNNKKHPIAVAFEVYYELRRDKKELERQKLIDEVFKVTREKVGPGIQSQDAGGAPQSFHPNSISAARDPEVKRPLEVQPGPVDTGSGYAVGSHAAIPPPASESMDLFDGRRADPRLPPYVKVDIHLHNENKMDNKFEMTVIQNVVNINKIKNTNIWSKISDKTLEWKVGNKTLNSAEDIEELLKPYEELKSQGGPPSAIKKGIVLYMNWEFKNENRGEESEKYKKLRLEPATVDAPRVKKLFEWLTNHKSIRYAPNLNKTMPLYQRIFRQSEPRTVKDAVVNFRTDITNWIEKSGTQPDYIVVIINSHGCNRTQIFTDDLKPVELFQEIVYELDHKKFPELDDDVPRLYLVNACQENKADYALDAYKKPDPEYPEYCNSPFFVLFSTVPNENSYGGTATGTTFFRAINDEFKGGENLFALIEKAQSRMDLYVEQLVKSRNERAEKDRKLTKVPHGLKQTMSIHQSSRFKTNAFMFGPEKPDDRPV